MKLKLRGRNFELPIIGLRIKKIIFFGSLTLVFSDEEESCLMLEWYFKVTQYSQTKTLDPWSKEGFAFFHDHCSCTIKEAKADRRGNLWLTFDNGSEMVVEEGMNENWQYIKKNLHIRSNELY
jgi:hypothetical protein